jgi:chorismate mutase
MVSDDLDRPVRVPHREEPPPVSTTAASTCQQPSTDQQPVPAETPGQLDDPATVLTLRGQIDALDAAIVRLVGERAQLSRRIQTARLNAGGTRVELGRERTIIEHYRSALGGAGSGLADAVLRVCRGSR